MGAWGYKALESDAGLDVVDFISDYISTKYPTTTPVHLTLSALISTMKESGFLGATFTDIDFYYDNTAMALAELYLMFKTTGQLAYENEEEETRDLKKRVVAFTADKTSIRFLLQYLTDIKNEVPDEEGSREIVLLWKDAASYPQWEKHLNDLIEALKAEEK